MPQSSIRRRATQTATVTPPTGPARPCVHACACTAPLHPTGRYMPHRRQEGTAAVLRKNPSWPGVGPTKQLLTKEAATWHTAHMWCDCVFRPRDTRPHTSTRDPSPTKLRKAKKTEVGPTWHPSNARYPTSVPHNRPMPKGPTSHRRSTRIQFKGGDDRERSRGYRYYSIYIYMYIWWWMLSWVSSQQSSLGAQCR